MDQRSVATATRWRLLGCDFSSAPNRRKPIVLALGELVGDRVELAAFERFESLVDFGRWLAKPCAPGTGWVGAFDFPFGLPRELVLHMGWPNEWRACMRHYAALPRSEIRALFAAFCNQRPAGAKFAHRATDRPAGSSPSMKWVNPPVAFMLHAGVPLLLDAGVRLPGLCAGDPQRIALEGYPGLLARESLGRRSYKADDRSRQSCERRDAREYLVERLERGETRLGLGPRLPQALRSSMIADGSGDHLDAALCLMQAAWALAEHRRGEPSWGLPAFDPLEGWIITA